MSVSSTPSTIPAGVRRWKPGDHVEQGRLAGAVGTDQTGDLARRRDERHVVEREVAAVAHRQFRRRAWVPAISCARAGQVDGVVEGDDVGLGEGLGEAEQLRRDVQAVAVRAPAACARCPFRALFVLACVDAGPPACGDDRCGDQRDEGQRQVRPVALGVGDAQPPYREHQ